MQSNFSCPRTCLLVNSRWCRFRAVTDKLGPVKVDSHVAKIDLEIRDLEALTMAAERLGLRFNRGQTSYRWYGRSVGDYPLPEGFTEADLGKCNHAIGLNSDSAYAALSKHGQVPYEIGVVDNGDGTFTLLWDFFAGGFGLEDVVGADAKNLTDEYAVCVIERAAQQQGWQYERQGNAVTIYHPSGGTLTYTAGTVDANGFHGQGCHEAILALGLPIENMQAKPEYTQTAALVQIGA